MQPDIRLAYDTPRGRACYIGGSGLSGEAQYQLGRRVLSHQAVLALLARKNRRGRTVPCANRTVVAHAPSGVALSAARCPPRLRRSTAGERRFQTCVSSGIHRICRRALRGDGGCDERNDHDRTTRHPNPRRSLCARAPPGLRWPARLRAQLHAPARAGPVLPVWMYRRLRMRGRLRLGQSQQDDLYALFEKGAVVKSKGRTPPPVPVDHAAALRDRLGKAAYIADERNDVPWQQCARAGERGGGADLGWRPVFESQKKARDE